MKRKQICWFIVLFFSYGISGCKKMSIVRDKKAESDILDFAKARDFYDKAIGDFKSTSLLNVGIVDWKSEFSFKYGNEIYIGLNLKSNFLKKFLKVILNEDGSIKSETQKFIFFNKMSEFNAQEFHWNYELFNFSETKLNFSGCIFEYSLSGIHIDAKKYIKGKIIEDFVTDLVRYKYSNGSNDAGIRNSQTNSFTCINWYLNTYINNVLVSSVYVFTTCEGEPTDTVEGDGPGGGVEIPFISITRDEDFVIHTHQEYQTNWTVFVPLTISGKSLKVLSII